jgi:hypothetical protein
MFKATRQIAYPKSPTEAFADVQQALARVGKLRSADEAAGTVEGATRYGVQKVRVHIKIAAAEGHSLLTINARGDDIWGVAARNGIQQIEQVLGHAEDAGAHAATDQKKLPAQSLGGQQTLSQKISAALFFAMVGIGSLDVAWHGFAGLSVPTLYAICAVLGAVMGLCWVKRRYAFSAALSGAIAGFTSTWFTVFVLEQSPSIYKIALVFTVVFGALPGLAVLLGLKAVQDFLFPPLADDNPNAATD